ncbi:DUF4157 domain-containing protein [Spongiactinospora sp. TRM90649]|uniref:eCIS core domain-containing protein n=1 Tax=Spongiactinospora sp. TRM90649 TaxID=3031114 RepID=UPI0023F94048|nr:DUF4157 domain-containing protein [Spongiactinospora sp. TRM90649]MDF5753122.1 DUF4157 domain-containing protein [Spongiactinospora sp. TRM90649]
MNVHREHQVRPPDREALRAVTAVVESPGEALDGGTRVEMETRFGFDFSRVRVHSGEAAVRAARRIDAAAFTCGHHIALGVRADRHVLAHELAHVVQQAGAEPGPPLLTAPGDASERAADAAADAVVRGQAARVRPAGVPAGTLMRQTPRLDRGYAGEQQMGFAGYPAEEGWAFLEGPSGVAGHGPSHRGFDGVAVRFPKNTVEIHLMDNKSLARGGNVSSATALTKNLITNLDTLITKVSAPGYNALPPNQLKLVRDALGAARASLLAPGAPMPATVRLIVTNAGGASTGVTEGLARRGVVFRDLQTIAPVPVPGAGTSSLAAHLSGEQRAIKRMVVITKVVKAGLLVLQIIGELDDALSMVNMAQSKLAGGAFILHDEVRRAKRLRDETDTMLKEYSEYHRNLGVWKWQLLKLLGRNAERMRAAASDALRTLGELESFIADLDTRMTRVERTRQGAQARKQAAEGLLEKGALGLGALGATAFGAYQDLGEIDNALGSAHIALTSARQAATADRDFFVTYIRECVKLYFEALGEAAGGGVP